MAGGYIKLWRKTLDSGVLQNHKAWSLLGWLFLSVSRKKYKYYGTVVNPGEVIMSVPEVAMRVSMTIDELRGAIKFLENLEIITTSPDWAGKRKTRFHVNNWRRYQENELDKTDPIENTEIELSLEGIPSRSGESDPIATGLSPDSYIMNKKVEKGSNHPTLKLKDSGSSVPTPQRLKATLDSWQKELYLTNFYPAWDSRSPRYRGLTPEARESIRQEWIARFQQEPLRMPDFNIEQNSRGEYGNVLLRALWEDLRGQELARKFQS